jgi:hypothetical protein
MQPTATAHQSTLLASRGRARQATPSSSNNSSSALACGQLEDTAREGMKMMSKRKGTRKQRKGQDWWSSEENHFRGLP